MQNMVLLHSDDSLFKDIHLCICGEQKCKPLQGWGPAVKSYYFILYVLNGKGVLTIGSQKYTIGEKEGFLVEPGQKVQYLADEKDPWECIWIGFTGANAGEYVKELGLGDQRIIFHNQYKDTLKQIVKHMLEHSLPDKENEYFIQGYLFQFLAVLMQDMKIPFSKEKESNFYVSKALEYIRSHYENMKIQELADYVNVNRGYLYSLFIRELGISPKEYLTTFRMSRAAELLKSTSYAVSTIAASCGYQDPALFSKAFHKQYGMSPSVFRKQSKS